MAISKRLLLYGAIAVWVPSSGAVEANVDAVATSLAKCFHAMSVRDDREYTAAIVSDTNGYSVQIEVSEPGLDVAWMTIRLKAGQSLVGLWHTHGRRGFGRERFSAADVALGRRLGVTMYLTNPKGQLRRLDPPRRENGRPSQPEQGTLLGHVLQKDWRCEHTLSGRSELLALNR